VQAPIIPIVGDMARGRPGTISLGQGVVHYGPPPQAFAQLDTFLEDGENHKYHAVEGIPSLRTEIRRKLDRENGIGLDGPDGDGSDGRQVCVTAGANMAFNNALLAIADPGDEIILLTPYYFNQEMAVRMASCRPVLVPTDDRYQPDIKAIARAVTERTRAVVTISPNNPTGAVYPEATLREINRLCRDRNIYHISDEAYEYFLYDDAKHFSPGSESESASHTISLFSLSKAYGFASWRIGYMVYPERLETSVKKIQDTILICPPVVSQTVAAGALRVGSSYCRPYLAGMSEVRQILMDELARLGSLCTTGQADGAFYCLLKIDTQLDEMTLVRRLVEEHGVAVIPGQAFGLGDGCYLRVSYGALQKETAVEGIGRLVSGLKTICGV
ncbi:MAG TPA: pyridoxal phosphate-dependent aminotransferase, partial [Thermoguttaceae bacterium]|nr:pyridoxal phosphate-dependent aminotransferase [Thermoguttaceae bacterium]